MESTSAIIYPIINENALMVGIEAFERTSLSQAYLSRPKVRAAGHLGKNSLTEIVDVNKLSQKSTSVIQYVEIAEAQGRLYCIDGLVSTSCWLRIITLANDCQSSNVLLMINDKGVILKTLKDINPGEPLLMWFDENILAMLDIPFLKPHNIQRQNRYICHICNNLFEYPNPLKIHLALKCSRLDNNHFWSMLAKQFDSSLKPNLSASKSSFKFKLTKSSQVPSNRISPTSVQTTSTTDPVSTNNDSSQSSNQISPSSSNQLSSNSLFSQISSNSSTQRTSIRKDIPHRYSAFKPYADQNKNVSPLTRNETVLTPYNIQTTVAPIGTDIHAEQMETIVSNLGKSRQGHICIYCGKIYSRKYGLKIHIRTHTGYKPLKCKYCMRPFGDPSNLNKHVRLHVDGETPYKCALCGKLLVRKRDLERHLKSRHEENRDIDQASDTSSDGIDV